MSKNHILKQIFMLSIIFFVGCAMQQKTFDSNIVNQIVKGKSTKADVIKLLGKPKSINKTDFGNEMTESWSYTQKGVTTGNKFGDSLLREMAPLGMLGKDIENSDHLYITFKGDIVSGIAQSTRNE